MHKRLGAGAIVVAAVSIAAGLLANPSHSAALKRQDLKPAGISSGFFTGMKAGKPSLTFKLDGGGQNNTATFLSFKVRLPHGDGLRFNRGKVMKGTACHGSGTWRSTPVNVKEMRCTPRVPLAFADAATQIGISALHEATVLRQKVTEHKIMKLIFYVTVEDAHHNAIPLRGVGIVKN